MLKSIHQAKVLRCIFMIAIFTGILGIAANCIIYQQKNGKNLLIWKLISDILWLFHYLSLNAYSGCAVALIGVFRELVFYRENKKGQKRPFFLMFFIVSLASTPKRCSSSNISKPRSLKRTSLLKSL